MSQSEQDEKPNGFVNYVLLMGNESSRGVFCLTEADPAWPPEGDYTLGDALSFSGLTSKISPLGSMLNFDADVKKIKRPRVTNVKTH